MVNNFKKGKQTMWARIMGSQLVEIINIPKAMTINNIQYPKSIFTRAWTDEERKALGIVPYVYEGSSGENMFYTSSESSPAVQADKVVVTKSRTPRDIKDIKDTMKNHVSSVLQGSLAQTDWIVIREQDNGTAKPADLAKWRTDLRAKAAALETAIDAKSDVAGLEGMTVFTKEMEDAGKKCSEFDEWPVHPRTSK
tara:strand:+ start:123 stop:710 length:588 start_codon:yes stop_codon:yes gene_type:complete